MFNTIRVFINLKQDIITQTSALHMIISSFIYCTSIHHWNKRCRRYFYDWLKQYQQRYSSSPNSACTCLFLSNPSLEPKHKNYKRLQLPKPLNYFIQSLYFSITIVSTIIIMHRTDKQFTGKSHNGLKRTWHKILP